MDDCIAVVRDLEKKHDIRVLYAVDAGSRAWGWPSAGSDYDIRFIYVHNDRRNYLSLNGNKKQVIDGFNEDRTFDWQGWDVAKALTLLHQANPTIVEWLESEVVYYNADPEVINSFKDIMRKAPRLLTLLHHYRSMSKGQYVEHIAKKTRIGAKKYLCAVRPAAMIEWLKFQYGGLVEAAHKPAKLIEVDFTVVWEDLRNHVNPEIHAAVLDLISHKKSGSDEEVDSMDFLNAWLAGIINRQRPDLLAFEEERKQIENANRLTLGEYDDLFFKIIGVKLG